MKFFCSAVCFLVLSTSAFAQQPANAASSPTTTSAKPEIAPPAHPITLEQTRKMFELMDFQNMMDGMMNQMIAIQNQQAPFIPPAVWDDFRATFKKTDFVTLFLPVYQKYLSEEDAAKSLEFYETPAGRRMLRSMPLMMGDISSVAGQKGQEIGQAVVQRHMDEIKAAAKKYQDEHASPAATPSSEAPATAPPPAAAKPDSPK
jgi:uncharacterized protein